MTEYEEITQNFTKVQYKIELEYQVKDLGYSLGDSFPSYLIDKYFTLYHETLKL